MQHRALMLRQPCAGGAKPLQSARETCSARLWHHTSGWEWHWHHECRPCTEQLSVRSRTAAQLPRQSHTAAQLPVRMHNAAVQASKAPGPAAPYRMPLQARQTTSGGAVRPEPGPAAPCRQPLRAAEALHEGGARPAPPAPVQRLAAGTAQSMGGGPGGQAVPEVLQSVSDAVPLPAGSSGSGLRVPEYWQARCSWACTGWLSEGHPHFQCRACTC